jgi:hypothetical protein
MSRVSKFSLPSWPSACSKSVCVYNTDGVCDNVRINKGNSDAACHSMNNKDVLKIIRVLARPACSSGAEFSPCRTWRYHLWREWDASKKRCAFIMLNPSTADETKNDPTVERCQRRAKAMGYGRLDVGNIFALRSTDPKALYDHYDPVGPANDAWLLRIAEAADLLVLGWGNHGKLGETPVSSGRGARVIDMLRGYRPHTLRITSAGEPGHPLYVAYSEMPVPWTPELRYAAVTS